MRDQFLAAVSKSEGIKQTLQIQSEQELNEEARRLFPAEDSLTISQFFECFHLDETANIPQAEVMGSPTGSKPAGAPGASSEEQLPLSSPLAVATQKGDSQKSTIAHLICETESMMEKVKPQDAHQQEISEHDEFKGIMSMFSPIKGKWLRSKPAQEAAQSSMTTAEPATRSPYLKQQIPSTENDLDHLGLPAAQFAHMNTGVKKEVDLTGLADKFEHQKARMQILELHSSDRDELYFLQAEQQKILTQQEETIENQRRMLESQRIQLEQQQELQQVYEQRLKEQDTRNRTIVSHLEDDVRTSYAQQQGIVTSQAAEITRQRQIIGDQANQIAALEETNNNNKANNLRDAMRKTHEELQTARMAAIEEAAEMASLKKMLENTQREMEHLKAKLKSASLANQEWADYCADLKVC